MKALDHNLHKIALSKQFYVGKLMEDEPTDELGGDGAAAEEKLSVKHEMVQSFLDDLRQEGAEEHASHGNE